MDHEKWLGKYFRTTTLQLKLAEHELRTWVFNHNHHEEAPDVLLSKKRPRHLVDHEKWLGRYFNTTTLQLKFAEHELRTWVFNHHEKAPVHHLAPAARST